MFQNVGNQCWRKEKISEDKSKEGNIWRSIQVKLYEKTNATEEREFFLTQLNNS